MTFKLSATLVPHPQNYNKDVESSLKATNQGKSDSSANKRDIFFFKRLTVPLIIVDISK